MTVRDKIHSLNREYQMADPYHGFEILFPKLQTEVSDFIDRLEEKHPELQVERFKETVHTVSRSIGEANRNPTPQELEIFIWCSFVATAKRNIAQMFKELYHRIWNYRQSIFDEEI